MNDYRNLPGPMCQLGARGQVKVKLAQETILEIVGNNSCEHRTRIIQIVQALDYLKKDLP